MDKAVTQPTYEELGWKKITCHNCDGHGFLWNYLYEGPADCNYCDGRGMFWETPKGRIMDYPGGHFMGMA